MKGRGVIFDLDGTLIEPAIDFLGMREALGILEGDVLEEIAGWGDEARALEAMEVIARFEGEAAKRMRLMGGASELARWFRSSGAEGIRRGIVTRNNEATVRQAIALLSLDFWPMIDRSFLPPKPAPAALLHILEQWGASAEEVWMVGDTRHDLEAARGAGLRCCLVVQPYNRAYVHEAEAQITRLDELPAVLGWGE